MKRLFLAVLIGLLAIISVAADPATDTSCGDVSANLLLTDDVVANGTCFTITVDDVVLDCAGYSINFSADGTAGRAVTAIGTNITVQNCVMIQGAPSTDDYAVLFDVSSGSLMHNVIEMLDDGNFGIEILSGHTSDLILNNSIIMHGDASTGIRLGSGSTDMELQLNFVNLTSSTGQPALYVNSNSGASISLNSFVSDADNQDVVIFILSNGTVFQNNSVTSTGTSGRAVNLFSGGQDNWFVNNLLSSDGIELSDSSGLAETNYLVFNNSLGQIKWESGNISYSGDLDIGSEVFLNANLLGLDAIAGLDNLDSEAEITFRGLPEMEFAPLLLRDGVECVGCTINSFSGGIVDVTVPGFSNYSTNDNAANGSRCGFVKGDLTLTAGINSTGTCLTINASDITIDCAGNWVNYTSSGYAINLSGHSNVTIKDCRIHNQGSPAKDAVYIYMSDSCVLQNLTLNDLSGSRFTGIYNWRSNDTQILDSYLYGDTMGDTVLSVNESSGVTIQDNRMGSSYALRLDLSDDCIVQDNRLDLGTGIWRMQLTDSDSNTIIGNNITIAGLGADGVVLVTSDLNTLDGNRVSTDGNGAYGFMLDSSDSNTLRSNRVSSGTDDNPCVLLDASDTNTLEDNLLNTSDAGSYAVELDTQSSGNTLRNNNISVIGIMDRTNSSVANTLSYNSSYGRMTWSTGSFAQNLTCNGTELSLARFNFAANAAAMNYSGFSIGLFNSSATVSLLASGVSSANRIYFYDGYLLTGNEVLENGSECQGSFCSISAAGSGTVTFTADRIGSFASKYVYTGGGGGGGGSGSSSSEWKSKKQWSKVLKGEILSVLPSELDSEVPFDSIDFKMANARSSVALQVRSHAENPTGARIIGAIKFIEISTTNIETGDFDGAANISFSVNANQVRDQSRIALYRYVAGNWVKLQTTLVRQQGMKLYYVATTPGFSFFAIAEEGVPDTSSDTTSATGSGSSGSTSAPSGSTSASSGTSGASSGSASQPEVPATPSGQTSEQSSGSDDTQSAVSDLTPARKSAWPIVLLLAGVILAAGVVVFAVTRKKKR